MVLHSRWVAKKCLRGRGGIQYKIPLRLHEGSGGSVGGTSGKGTNLPGPVNAPARFRSVVSYVYCARGNRGPGAVAGLPAGRLVASHFSVMSKNCADTTAGPR